MKGKITSYSPEHGYGFINDNIYFHVKEWTLRLPPVVGMNVTCKVKDTPKGKKAEDIKRDY